MSSSLVRRRRTLIVVGVLAALAMSAAAFAYFTSTGSGTGSASVGTASQFTVTPGTSTGSVFPGAGSASIPFTVTNAGTGNQQVSSITAAVKASGGNIVENGTAVAGCSASWFTATVQPITPALPRSVAPNGTVTGTVALTMADSGTVQDACQGHTPQVTISAG